MKILVIGGTRFVGRHFAEAAFARGHDLTLLHRGAHPVPELVAATHLIGDREKDLDRLLEGTWDAVLDTCGYYPRVVGMSTRHLRGRVGCYLFVSTISVYSDSVTRGLTEDGPLATIADPTVEEITKETYGALKVLCEQEVERSFGKDALIVRPGIIIGPHDPSDRFTWWVRHAGGGGELIAPDSREQVQGIDARDLGAFMVHLLEQGIRGIYHGVGPVTERWTLPDIAAAAQRSSDTGDTIHWADPKWLIENDALPWRDFPMWLTKDDGDGLFFMNMDRSAVAGLRTRPLAETVMDTLAWDRARGIASEDFGAGLKPARIAELIAKWKARA